MRKKIDKVSIVLYVGLTLIIVFGSFLLPNNLGYFVFVSDFIILIMCILNDVINEPLGYKIHFTTVLIAINFIFLFYQCINDGFGSVDYKVLLPSISTLFISSFDVF